jgi:hypothetical protein
MPLIIDIYSNLNDHNPLLIGPQFEDPEIFDYHLSVDSPDIDAGNPDPSYNDRDGTQNDLGAFGGLGAGISGPDYELPELDTNDLVFEQEDPNGTLIIYSKPALLPDGLLELYAQAEGEGVPYIIATAWDNDLLPPFLIEPAVDANGQATQIFDYGTTPVTITVRDGYGWEVSGTADVTIQDTLAPVPDVDPLPEVTLECPGTITEIPTAWDAGVGTVFGDANGPMTFEDPNTYVITWIYDDGRGNVSTQDQTVIIEDTLPPDPNVEVLPDITGDCSVEVTEVPIAIDGCAGIVEGTTTDPLLYEDQGTYTITWTYDDGNGNTSTQEQTVIVEDTNAPVPDAESLATVTGECSAEVTAIPTATDNCDGSIIGTTTDPLSYDVAGTYTITWSYEDSKGNIATQEQTVMVEDVTAPVPDAENLADITEQCSVEVTTSPTATDNCGGSITGTTTDPLSYDEEGTYTITWTYDDGNGNTATQEQTVIVEDTEAPTASAGNDKNVKKGTEVTLQATASDNCDGEMTYEWKEGENVLGNTSTLKHTFAVGTHTVNLTVTDEAGNSASDTVKVKVTTTTTTGTYPYQYGYPYFSFSYPRVSWAPDGGFFSAYYSRYSTSGTYPYSYSLYTRGLGGTYTPYYSLGQFYTPRYTYPMSSQMFPFSYY